VGIAPTGSGKTLAYGLHLGHALGNALVLVPTRELARQVEKELKTVSNKTILCIYGGMDRSSQVAALTEAIQSHQPWIVAATTGRLVDVLEEDSLPPFKVDSVILDEADRMASNVDMGRQVDEILKQLRDNNVEGIRVSIFSATSPLNVQDKWKEWTGGNQVCIKINTMTLGENACPVHDTASHDETNDAKPAADSVALENKTKTRELDFSMIPSHVVQILHVCSAHKKPRKLMNTLQKIRKEESRQRGLCLVFFAKIKTLQYVSKLLNQEGYKAAEFHSQMKQSMREKTLLNFKAGKMPTLLATDIAARGIHVSNIEYVVNYDFPGSLDQYVHRCGRAGRDQSSSATVYSFFTRDFAPMAKDVVALLESSNAWIDPNLRELVGTDGCVKKKQKRQRIEKDHEKSTFERLDEKASLSVNNKANDKEAIAADDDDWDDGQFASLNGNRIVPERAGHVSDASSCSVD
jgi:ATP-dependent RNA helicase DDX5/DBP2